MDITSLTGSSLGDYAVLSVVGAGGSGVVYKAHEDLLDRVVALRVVAPELVQDTTSAKFLMEEMRAVARLNHPHITRVYGLVEEGVVHGIAMEYVLGGTVAAYIQARGKMKIGQALNIAYQAAEALVEAHGEGVFHLNIHPGNIMSDSADCVKLMDFGVARYMQSVARLTDAVVAPEGPAYKAPEQLLGKPVDARTDIYALGMTLFEMLTGTTAYTAAKPSDVVRKVLEEPLPDLQMAPYRLPYNVAMVVLRMTAKQAKDRFSSAREVLEALQVLRSGG
jgi:serine/threonine-protein kinase